MNQNHQLDQIDAYLTGEMNPDEERRFEAELLTNLHLKQATEQRLQDLQAPEPEADSRALNALLEGYRRRTLAQNWIREAQKDAAREPVISDEKTGKTRALNSRPPFWTYIAALAACMALIFMTLLPPFTRKPVMNLQERSALSAQQSTPNPDSLMRAHIVAALQPDPLVWNHKLTADQARDIRTQLATRDIHSLRSFLENKKSRALLNADESCYLALAYLQSFNWDKSRSLLLSLQNDPVAKPGAMWYLGLGHLSNGNRRAAAETLNQLYLDYPDFPLTPQLEMLLEALPPQGQ